MKRLLAYLFLVLGLMLVSQTSSNAVSKNQLANCVEIVKNYKSVSKPVLIYKKRKIFNKVRCNRIKDSFRFVDKDNTAALNNFLLIDNRESGNTLYITLEKLIELVGEEHYIFKEFFAQLPKKEKQTKIAKAEPSQTQKVVETVSLKLNKNEVDAIFSSVNSCWSIPLGLPYNQDLSVKIEVKFDSSGNAIRTEIIDHAKINKKGNAYLKVLAESALRAIKLCSPIRAPKDKYDLWKEVVFNFDAKDVLNGTESKDTKIAKNNLLNKTIKFNQTIKKEKVKKQKFSQFDFKANQIILINSNTNQILYEKNSDQKINPAGFTKIMTSIIVFDAIKNGQISLKDKLSVSEKAWKISTSGYSAMFVMNGDSISVENLLRGLIVASGNDAAIVLAEGLAGSENNFVKLMNDKAKEIGLNYTKFGNSTGIIIPTNTTTVKDVAIMSSYLINNYPELYYFFGEKQFTWNRTGGDPITQGNRNPLLYKNMNVDGLRTSYNQTDRYGLASSMYLKNNDDRLIVVGSGFKDKNARSKGSSQLLTLGKTNYHTFKIAKKEPSKTQKVASNNKKKKYILDIKLCSSKKNIRNNDGWVSITPILEGQKFQYGSTCHQATRDDYNYLIKKNKWEFNEFCLRKDSSKRSKNIQTKLLSPKMKKCSDLGSDYETVKYDGKNYYVNEPTYLAKKVLDIKKTQIAKAEQGETILQLNEKGAIDIWNLDKKSNTKKKVKVAKVKPKQEEFKPKKTNQDNEAPVITIAEAITVDSQAYTLKGEVKDKSQIYLTINGRQVDVKKGKFELDRFSIDPDVAEELKIVAIDQWNNKSEKIVKVTIDLQSTDIAKVYEELKPNNVKVKTDKNKIAIIIGIEKYENLTNLDAKYANRDAKAFRTYATRALGIKPSNIKMLIDEKATRSQALKAFKLWLPKIAGKGGKDIHIFFAGHGLASDNGEDLYILPQDGESSLLEDTAISRVELISLINKVNPKSVTMFFDTCYSGQTRDERMLVASLRPIRIVADEQETPDNFTIFTASNYDQTSGSIEEAEHGMFSYYLMKGLEGKADENKDRKITNGELITYLKDNVSQEAFTQNRQQDPMLAGDPDKILIKF